MIIEVCAFCADVIEDNPVEPPMDKEDLDELALVEATIEAVGPLTLVGEAPFRDVAGRSRGYFRCYCCSEDCIAPGTLFKAKQAA